MILRFIDLLHWQVLYGHLLLIALVRGFISQIIYKKSEVKEVNDQEKSEMNDGVRRRVC